MGIILLMMLGIFIFGVVVYAFNYYWPSPSSGSRVQHSDNHPGITKNGKDNMSKVQKPILCVLL